MISLAHSERKEHANTLATSDDFVPCMLCMQSCDTSSSLGAQGSSEFEYSSNERANVLGTPPSLPPRRPLAGMSSAVERLAGVPKLKALVQRPGFASSGISASQTCLSKILANGPDVVRSFQDRPAPPPPPSPPPSASCPFTEIGVTSTAIAEWDCLTCTVISAKPETSTLRLVSAPKPDHRMVHGLSHFLI